MTETKSVQALAKELSAAFTHDKRNDGQEYVHLKNGSPEWMTEIIRAIHGDKMPDDTTYAFIEQCADAIADASDDNEDAIREAIDDIEPDSYTSNLTGWLHARVDHVYYLSEVLDEMGGDVKDGFQLLAMAQKKQIDEIGFALVFQLEQLAAEETEE
jgi:hypothetical protein